jgi:hypothetical protein
LITVSVFYLWNNDSCDLEPAKNNMNEIEKFNAFVEESEACIISALSAEQRKKHSASTVKLFSEVTKLEEESNGYSFQLPADSATLQEVSEWIDLERKCCPFMNFSLTVGDEKKPMTLRINGDENTKEFLKNSPLIQLAEK